MDVSDAFGEGPPGSDVGELTVLVVEAASVEVRGCGDDDLLARCRELEALRRAVDSACVAVVGELEARGVTDRATGFPTRTWLAVDGHLPREVAARRVKVAGLLRHCDLLGAGLRHGRISMDHVRVIAEATNDRNGAAVAQIQELLIDMTVEFPRFEAWASQVRMLLRLADPEGGHDPRPEDNRLRLSRGFTGDVQVDASLVGEAGEIAIDALNRMADALFERFTRDRASAPDDVVVPSRSALLALAFVDCCRLASGASGTVASPAADITLVIHSDEPEVVRTLDGRPVDPHTARLVCCDGVYHPLTMDSEGVPLDLGREVRFADRHQRRAVHRRDGGCVFPGCDAPARWTDVHHVVHWDDDGATDLRNLACLCRHHHGVVHRTGWTMETIGDQWFRITTPTGRVLISQRHGRPRPC